MDNVNYVYIPFLISLTVQFFLPYMKNMLCIDTWVAPHYLFCNLLFILSYFLFGVTLWKSKEVNNNEIFTLTWILVFINFVWIYNFKKRKELSLIFLFLCLLLGYFNYNALFLSDLTQPSNTLYINLYSVYMVWIGFMITILIETSPRFVNTKRKKKNKLL
jgi:hypothetical protein